MDLAAPQPIPLPASNRRTGLALVLAVAAAGIAAVAVGAASAPFPTTTAVHRVQVGPAGLEYYDATAGAALGERITDAYLEIGGSLPFAYAKAGPFFAVVSSSDGSHGRLTLGTDFA